MALGKFLTAKVITSEEARRESDVMKVLLHFPPAILGCFSLAPLAQTPQNAESCSHAN